MKYVEGKKTREPIGEPLRDYYPALIDEQTYHAIRAKLASRQSGGGPQTSYVNLFQGLLHDADDGSPAWLPTSSAAILP